MASRVIAERRRSHFAASPAVPDGASAVPITGGRAETRDVPIWLSGIGSVQPLNAVTVKVRVDGQLDRVAFTEGQDVHNGDVLAQIDPRSFRVQLKQAQANKAKDEAQLANAASIRSTKLKRRGRFQAEPRYAAGAGGDARGHPRGRSAAIEMAQLQLEFSTMTAPSGSHGAPARRSGDGGACLGRERPRDDHTDAPDRGPVHGLSGRAPEVLEAMAEVTLSSTPTAGVVSGYSPPAGLSSSIARSTRARACQAQGLVRQLGPWFVARRIGRRAGSGHDRKAATVVSAKAIERGQKAPTCLNQAR